MSIEVKRLVNATLVYGIGNIASRFISLLLLPFYTRYLTPSDYGVLAMLAIITIIGQQIFSLGLGASLGIEFFKQETQDQKKLVILHAGLILLFSSLIFVSINFMFTSQIIGFLFSSTIEFDLLKLNSIAVALQIFSIPFSSYLQFEERSKSYTIISISTLIVSICSSIVFVVLLKFSVKGILISFIIAQTMSLFLLLIYFKRKLFFKPSIMLIKNMLKQGFPFIPGFIALFVISQSSRLFVESRGGMDVLGLYSIGSNFGMIMSVFVGAFTTAWYPYFMSFINNHEGLKIRIKIISNMYLLLFGALCIIFFACSRPLMFLLDKSFHDSFYVVGFTAVSQILLGFHTILLPTLYFSDKVRSVSYVQLIVAGLSILINHILIKSGNALISAGISLAIAYFLLVFIQALWNLVFKKIVQFEYDWMFLLLSFVSILIIGVMLIIFPLMSLCLEIIISLFLVLSVVLFVFMFVFLKYNTIYLIISRLILTKIALK
jgi:O-antigen/teichoic acid export membrane protein